jgi:lipopolysaccharide biosynthesis glycosyltransferase
MAIPDIFPNLDKMLYIDCDTLVLKSLSPLYNTEMSENSIVAMVGDRFIMLSVRTVPKYHNSGMILFDIKKSREFNLFEKCCKWLKANKDIIEFPDQDAINHVLSGHIHRVSNVYNLQVVAYSNSLDYYLENNPAMLHFIGKIKPWSLSHLIHWAAPMYIKYIPFESDKRKIKIIAKMSKILFRCSPRFTLVKTPSKDPKKRTAEAMKYIEFKKQQPSVQDIK